MSNWRTTGASLLRARLHDVETVALRGVGHHPLVEEHERVSRLIADAVGAETYRRD